MRCERVRGAMSRWQTWRWALADVWPAELHPQLADRHCLERTEDHSLWLCPGHDVTLHRDDAEGYHLNLSTDQPVFWVMWRTEPLEDGGEPVAQPLLVTLSYHEAGRMLDAQETVEAVPAPAEVLEWLQRFIDSHYQPEPKRRKRPESFRTLSDRFGNPASVSTDKAARGGGARVAPDNATGGQGGRGQRRGRAKPARCAGLVAAGSAPHHHQDRL